MQQVVTKYFFIISHDWCFFAFKCVETVDNRTERGVLV
jgi:hypothetical protein